MEGVLLGREVLCLMKDGMFTSCADACVDLEEQVILQRLLNKTSVIGKPPIKKCSDHLFTLLHSIGRGNAIECNLAVNSLLWELTNLEFDASKAELVQATCEKELEEYTQLHQEIDKSIEETSKEIEELRLQFQDETIIRQYKEEYEAMAKVVNKFPTRKELDAAIAVENDSLQSTRETLNGVKSRLETRSKQFDLLMRTIQDLKSTFHEDISMAIEEPLQPMASPDREDEDEPDNEEETKSVVENEEQEGDESKSVMEDDEVDEMDMEDTT